MTLLFVFPGVPTPPWFEASVNNGNKTIIIKHNKNKINMIWIWYESRSRYDMNQGMKSHDNHDQQSKNNLTSEQQQQQW